MLTERYKLVGEQQQPTRDDTDREHYRQGRKDAARSADIEIGQAKAIASQSIDDNRRDQKSGDDKEYIDADITA